jgi:hypothetical protein
MFERATRKSVLKLLGAAALWGVLGGAARLAEDGLLGSSDTGSTVFFALAGLTLYYALVVAFVLFRRYLKSRSR